IDDRLGHDAILGGLGALRDGNSPRPFDGGYTVSAIAVRAGKDHTNSAAAVDGGYRSKHYINRRTRETDQTRVRQLDSTFADQQMFVGRAEVDCAPRNRLTVLCFFNRHARSAPQQLRNLAFVARIEMLHDQNGGASGLNRADNFEKCRQASRRRTNGDELTTVARSTMFSCPRWHSALRAAF